MVGSTAGNIRVFLAGVFLFLALLAVLTSRAREIRFRVREKKVLELGKKFKTFTFEQVSRELGIKEYNAKILLRKLASRGKIKVRRDGEKEEYYI